MTTIDEPILTKDDVPSLTSGQVLVLVVERLDERCVLNAALPEALIFEARAPDGTLLYVLYGIDPVPGWSIATSPAGTTVNLADHASCDAP